MGSELVGSLPTTSTKSFPYTELFWDAYPAYISMGMSYDEYWNGDAESCVAYRRARDERLKLEDAMLWRQGLYVYHAICDAAPLFNPLKPKKPKDYIEKPFGFEKPKPKEEQSEAGFNFVKAWADRVNKMRKHNGS